MAAAEGTTGAATLGEVLTGAGMLAGAALTGPVLYEATIKLNASSGASHDLSGSPSTFRRH
ncbi:hypothetical protein WCLP8_5150007 [uncultured Gammaproteobacteria bacterium]